MVPETDTRYHQKTRLWGQIYLGIWKFKQLLAVWECSVLQTVMNAVTVPKHKIVSILPTFFRNHSVWLVFHGIVLEMFHHYWSSSRTLWNFKLGKSPLYHLSCFEHFFFFFLLPSVWNLNPLMKNQILCGPALPCLWPY